MENEKKIPDEKECLLLLRQYDVLPNILEHSEKVKLVSLALADNLIDTSMINRDLVLASALLHDIAKTQCLKRRDLHHDYIGGKILRDMGYIRIAEIVESHVIMKDFNPTGRIEEREIVHYSDKRVMHDRIVTIDERIDDLINRYSRNHIDEEFIRKNRQAILTMEKKIQSHLSIGIDEAISGI